MVIVSSNAIVLFSCSREPAFEVNSRIERMMGSHKEFLEVLEGAFEIGFAAQVLSEYLEWLNLAN